MKYKLFPAIIYSTSNSYQYASCSKPQSNNDVVSAIHIKFMHHNNIQEPNFGEGMDGGGLHACCYYFTHACTGYLLTTESYPGYRG